MGDLAQEMGTAGLYLFENLTQGLSGRYDIAYNGGGGNWPPRKNISQHDRKEQSKFFSRVQNKGEPIDQFTSDLSSL